MIHNWVHIHLLNQLLAKIIGSLMIHNLKFTQKKLKIVNPNYSALKIINDLKLVMVLKLAFTWQIVIKSFQINFMKGQNVIMIKKNLKILQNKLISRNRFNIT
ncbi:UNKNOWN [Stylonychia lemnae]|uniref:Transmembrane protein n=1 Tax=Stylonychia lemnae TaxID=5949 RepID=A0A077ZQY7_STYLE|nr:UNKNOWN [Stylonychia lemnae]|eukprot:CDW71795.1 UNKNOWN [Stylonychia lemnae]